MSGNWKERIYADYYETHILPRKGPLTEAKLRSVAKSFDHHFGEYLPTNKGVNILDIGCGSGSLVWWLGERGYANASGIDLSESQLAAGRGLGIRNLYREQLADYVKRVGEGTCAMVFLRDVLEHLDKCEVMAFLDLVHSLLAPGGAIVLQLPNGSSPFFGRVRYGDFTHVAAYTETSLSQVLLLAGFNEPHCKGFEPRPVRTPWWELLKTTGGRRIIRRELSWALVKRFYRFLLYAETGSSNHVVTFNLICHATKGED